MSTRAARTKSAPPPAVDPALATDAADLLEALTQLVRVYQFRDRNRICAHDVTVSQCHALQAIARRETPGVNELAAAQMLDKSTASRLVAGLEEKGYVRRAADARDGRAVRLAVTARGRQVLARIERDLLEEQIELVRDFPPEVRRAAAQLILRLADATRARVARSCGARKG
jgi:MarR family 2-MHQ and catechol resistance regulon transcriptional repressor